MIYIPLHNIVDERSEDWYISYNPVDVDLYGDTTTALVIGQGHIFLILNGNHRDQYKACKNLAECISYFNRNKDQRNKYSDKI